MNKRILVMYYSHSGNTKRLAELIAARTHGDLLAIEPETPYPTAYDTVVAQAKKEIRDGYQPPITTPGDAADAYDVVFIGTPNWWSTVAPPIATFLSAADLSDKTIIPFCTHGGGGEARCFSDTAKHSRGAITQKGFSAYGDSAMPADIDAWLRELGMA
ncbi:flavodoxin [Eubacteriales bacterium OttesenSCG-928-A19]|nr:flavodoxin [Eubacteriales bacterium OttesenSCG-928-A19]